MSLLEYGWTERIAALGRELSDGPLARVVRVDVDRCLVATDRAVTTVRAEVLPAVGDWVVLDANEMTVAASLPRWSVLVRHDREQAKEQVLAANVDVVLCTVPLDRAISLNRIERELVVARNAPASAIVVLTKADTVPDAEILAAEVRDRCVGAEVVVASTVDGRGIEQLREVPRPDHTVVLLGASGAGKSTLANELLGAEVLATAEVRARDRRGQHTTTTRHLLPLPGGGVLLDTPGLRSLHVWNADEGLAAAFADIEALVHQCKFRDCAHDTEPGCAVNAAVARGELDPARLASYLKLEAEITQAERTRYR